MNAFSLFLDNLTINPAPCQIHLDLSYRPAEQIFTKNQQNYETLLTSEQSEPLTKNHPIIFEWALLHRHIKSNKSTPGISIFIHGGRITPPPTSHQLKYTRQMFQELLLSPPSYKGSYGNADFLRGTGGEVPVPQEP